MQEIKSIGMTPQKLRPGDILFETDFREKTHALHKTIRTGQFLQSSSFPDGHRQSVHVLIVVQADDAKDKPLKVVEVVGKGVRLLELSDLKKCTYFVSRSLCEDFGREYARVAYFMYKYLRDHPGNREKSPSVKPITKITDDVEVSRPSGFKHVATGSSLEQCVAAEVLNRESELRISKPSNFTVKGSGQQIQYSRVKAALSILIPYNEPFPEKFKKEICVSLNNFCSMFVIECMQLTQDSLGLKDYIRLQKESSPRSLEDYLKNHDGFSFHVIPKDHEVLVQSVLVDILHAEIKRMKSSNELDDQKKGKAAESQLEYLLELFWATQNNFCDFDKMAVVLSRTLPLLGWPESVLKETRVFGLGNQVLESKDLKEIANVLLDIDLEDNKLGM